MRFPLTIAALTVLSPALAGAIDFNFDVRPVLSDRCFFCHGPDEENRKGKLRLDTAEGAKEVIANGELMARITSTDPDEQMPPPESNLSISKPEVAAIREWIAAGADYKDHWAFIPLQPVPVPGGAESGNPIDAFVSA